MAVENVQEVLAFSHARLSGLVHDSGVCLFLSQAKSAKSPKSVPKKDQQKWQKTLLTHYHQLFLTSAIRIKNFDKKISRFCDYFDFYHCFCRFSSVS